MNPFGCHLNQIRESYIIIKKHVCFPCVTIINFFLEKSNSRAGDHLRKKIQDLAYARFYSEKPVIVAPTEPVEFEVFPGDVRQGSFVVRSANREPLHGTVCSTHSRIKCLTADFTGTECVLFFEFESRGLRAGEISKGEITVSSDGGECSVHFLARIVQRFAVSTVGNIRNTDDFARLAKSSPDEAYHIYTSAGFAGILEQATERERLLYRALGGAAASMVGMEEFLVGAGKKEPLTFSLTEHKLDFAAASEDEQEQLEFQKEGWGYLDIAVASDNDAFVPVKSRITSADLVGNHGVAEFIIRKDRLHGGKNFGRIVLESLHRRESCEICVYADGRAVVEQERQFEQEPEFEQDRRSRGLEEQRLLVRLTRVYLDFRMQRMENDIWEKESSDCLERLRKLMPENKWYMLYDLLTTLKEQEYSYAAKVFHRIRDNYQKNQENLWLFLMILFLDPQFERNGSRKLSAIREKVAEGLHSPILYLEAYELLKKDVYLVQKADDFELQVLNWAAKEHVLVPAIARQVVKIMFAVRSFHPLWYRILQECYRVAPETETLAAIVSYCIRWNVTTPKQFSWFQLGVREGLNIAGLYEAWMDSADAVQITEIPRPVTIYFQYQSNLDWRKRALLYAYILKSDHRQGIYEAYRTKIEEFAIEQIFAGNIDENLAVIYREVLEHMNIDEKTAKALSGILYICKVKTTDVRAVRLIAVQPELKRETSAVLVNGAAYLPIYSDNCLIMAENDRGVRYLLKEESVQIQKLLQPECYAKACAGMVKQEVWQQEERYAGACADAVKQEVWQQEDVTGCGFASKTFSMMAESGYEHIPVSRMLLVALEKLAEPERAEEEQLLKLCTALFCRGTYNEAVLAYLLRHFRGSLKDLERLWRAAGEFELDTYELEERFLRQLLFTEGRTESMEEIFLSYFAAQGQEMLLLAFLTYASYQYFVKEESVKEPVFSCIARQIAMGNPLNDCCRLACLRWLTEREERSETEEQLLEMLFLEAVRQGKMFAFYHKLPERLRQRYHLDDRIFLEYRTSPGRRVTLHYSICEAAEKEDAAYVSQERQATMTEMYQGIFVKELVLFCGERISYSIREEQKMSGTKELVTEGTVETVPDRKAKPDSKKMSRYDLINAMLLSRQNRDEQTLYRLRGDYERMERLAEEGIRLL